MGKISENKMRKGFTVIEVILFFAISAFLIVGLMLGVTSNIARQRYTDSVQDLTDWIKMQYQAVSNPKLPEWSGADLLDYTQWNGANLAANSRKKCNFTGSFTNIDDEDIPVGRGQSYCHFYGKLIVFGENDDQNRVTSYLVIGMDDRRRPVNELGVATTPTHLNGDPLNDLMVSDIFVPALDLSDSYNIPYSAQAQDLAKDTPLKAAILIVKPPQSGAVRTLILDDSIAVTDIWNSLRSSDGDPVGAFFPDALFTGSGLRKNGDLDICVGSDDVFAIGGKRRNIRVKADGGGNASAVELISDGDGICD